MEYAAWFCSRGPGEAWSGGQGRNLTTTVRQQVRSYGVTGRLGSESDVSTTAARPPGKTPKGQTFDQAIASRAASKLEEGEVKGAVRLLCSNNKLAAPNNASYNSLLTLHPKAAPDTRPSPSSSTT